MFYSNMLSNVKAGKYSRNNGESFPLIIEDNEKVSNCSVRVFDGSLCVTGTPVGENIFELRGNKEDVPTPFKGCGKLTYSDLADTEDNPLVVVCSKGIKFYNDIPTYIDVLFVNNDMMIAMLIYGACEFQFDDGSFLPLQRCNDVNLEGRKTHSPFTCESLKSMIFCKTKGGWDKSYEMVCPLLVRAKSNGDISVRCLADNAFVFNPEGIKKQEESEERKAEMERLAREKKKQEEEERKRILAEEAKKRREEEFLQRKAEAEAKATKVKKQTSKVSKKSSEGDTSKRSSGAEAFLAFVNGTK